MLFSSLQLPRRDPDYVVAEEAAAAVQAAKVGFSFSGISGLDAIAAAAWLGGSLALLCIVLPF